MYSYVFDPNGWVDVLGLNRRGNSTTQAQNEQLRDQFLNDNPGYNHIGGSKDAQTDDPIKETYLPPRIPVVGTQAGGSYTDLTFEGPNGQTVYIQTVDKGDFYGMSEREWENANRILRQDTDSIIITVEKGDTVNSGDLDISNEVGGNICRYSNGKLN